MQTLTTNFVIPDYISVVLVSEIYEHVGGVIHEIGSKQMVSWLREGLALDSSIINFGEILTIKPVHINMN